MHSAPAAAGKNNNGAMARGGGASRGPPRHLIPFDEVPDTSDALRRRLASLGATRPRFMVDKVLEKSDVHRDQARLLFSCKQGEGDESRFPLAADFTELEAQRVWDKQRGLLVTALDRAGRSYDLTCKYLTSNHAYRFISGWKPFVMANGLTLDGHGGIRRDVRVELWAFRSRQLPNGYKDEGKGKGEGEGEGEGKGKGKQKAYVRLETSHPDGSLGLVLLHYEDTHY